jgi:hypothetical protein
MSISPTLSPQFGAGAWITTLNEALRAWRAKAMFVAIDKATAIRMYDKLRGYWGDMLAREAKRVAATEDSVERGIARTVRLTPPTPNRSTPYDADRHLVN